MWCQALENEPHSPHYKASDLRPGCSAGAERRVFRLRGEKMTSRLLWLSIVVSVCAATSAANGQSGEPRRVASSDQSGAQTEPINLDEGKTAAQIFSSSCAVCHERPQGLAKKFGAGSLRGFLRQHYTIGTEQAAMLANYLTSGGLNQEAPARSRTARPERAPIPPAEPPTASRRPDKPEKPDEARKPNPAIAATQPARRIREESPPRPVEASIVLPPAEPVSVDVQKEIEAAVAEAVRKASATPLTEMLPAPDPARVQEIPL